LVELIKCVSENMFWRFFRKKNPKIIFQRGKTIFFKNDGCRKKLGRNLLGCRKKFVRVEKETTH